MIPSAFLDDNSLLFQLSVVRPLGESNVIRLFWLLLLPDCRKWKRGKGKKTHLNKGGFVMLRLAKWSSTCLGNKPQLSVNRSLAIAAEQNKAGRKHLPAFVAIWKTCHESNEKTSPASGLGTFWGQIICRSFVDLLTSQTAEQQQAEIRSRRGVAFRILSS